MLNRNEKQIARIMFKNIVFESDGQKYEDLFSKVMSKSNKNFLLVKPYGNIGDKKNDGFDKTKGVYYQVFAPEEIEKKKSISDAVKKLENDFEGLKKHWDGICPIQEFYYVVNDKYKGIPAPIHEKIIELNIKYNKTKCDVFPVNKLEDIFINLSPDDIVDVINFDPNPNVDILDYSVLTEAIRYILSCDADNSLDEELRVPDFEEKIKFNGLSTQVDRWLTTASYNMGDLDRYFRRNSQFTKQELRNKFNNLYIESKNTIDETVNGFNNQRFVYILEKACGSKNRMVRDSVLVLMACFFESCDIFEEPKED